MIKRINGLLYSTDSATMIGTYSHGSRVDDANWYEQTLYLKKTGEFFIYGVGGPRSPYCKPTDRAGWYISGEKIEPLTKADAHKWADDHLDPDVVDRYFSELNDDSPRRIVSFNLSESAISRLAAASDARGESRSSLIEALIYTL